MPIPKDKTDNRSKLGDFVEVLVPLGVDEMGNPRYEKGIVQRAGLSDEQWNQVKKQAADTERFSMVKEGERSPSADEAQTQLQASRRLGDAITFKDPGGATTIIPRGNMADSDWRQSLLEARKRDTFVSGSYNGESFEKQPVLTSEVGSQLGGEGQQVVPEVSKSESRPGSPEGFFGRAVVNALPGPAGMGTPPGPIPSGQGSLLDALPAPKGQETPAPASVDFATAAGTSQALGGPYAAGPGDAPKKVGSELLGPSPGAQMADLVQAGKESFAQPQTPAPAPAQPPVPTNVSAGVKMQGTPGAKPGATPGLGDVEKQFTEGMAKEADAQGEAGRERIAARAKYEADLQAFEAEQKKAQLRQREAEDRINEAYLSTLDDMSKKAQIDPDHFWATRSDGAKVGMLLSGFLAGLGGRDPAGQVERMVAQDIAVQRENYNMLKEAGKAKLAGLDTTYGRLRQRGLDDKEAASAARAAMQDGLARRMDDIADRLTDPVAKAKAQQSAAQFRLGIRKAEDELKTHAAQRVHMENQDAMTRFELGMKAQAAADKKAGGKGMQATLSKELQGLNDALASVRQMRADAGKGFVDRLNTWAGEANPLGGIVSPKERARGRDFRGRAFQMMTELARGALQPAEMDRLEKIIPQSVNPLEDPEQYLKMAEGFIQEQIARREAAYGDAGPDIRGESDGGQGR